MASLLKQGAALTLARYVEQFVMLLTPVVLVRTIGTDAFGEYRLFWLLVTTVAMVFPLGLPRSLLFFFVRLDADQRRLYVGQTVLFLIASTIVAAVLIIVCRHALPSGVSYLLRGHGLFLAAFLLIWNVGLLLDILPNATDQIRWQAQATLSISVIRAALLISAAVFTERLEWVLAATFIAACIRLALLSYFIARHCGIRLFPLDKAQFSEQLRYGVPFGAATLLFNMRKQTEQWIVAVMFSSGIFGVFSIATTLLMPFEVLRGVLGNLLLPKMSYLHSLGRREELLRLNNHGNVIVSAVMFPAIAALFAFADEVIQLLFTRDYVIGSPVLRIYLVQTLISTEITTLLYVFGQGSANLRYEAAILPFAVASSLLGAWYYGLPGAAIGSLAATFAVYALFLRKLSSAMSIPIRGLQDWRNLGMLLSASVMCAVVTRLSFDLLKVSGPTAAIAGPASVFGLYLTILMATGYYRTLACMRREWSAICVV